MMGDKLLPQESAVTVSSNIIQHHAVVSPPEINVSEHSNENISHASNEENQASENNNFNEEELDYFIASKSDTKTYFKKNSSQSAKQFSFKSRVQKEFH